MTSQAGAMTEELQRKTAKLIAKEGTGLEISQRFDRAQTVKELPRKEEDPTALDVINTLIDEKEEQKASEYMKGHVSQDLIHETFLMDAQQKFPESTLRINCDEHNAPATFYSRQEQKYQCLKCIVAKEDLHYIDKNYKRTLEDFENIKSFASKAINENEPHIHIIAEWKSQIRDTLLQVKEKYIEWIETFTNKFVKSLNKIEHSSQLAEFIGEDKRQELRLIDMQSKYRDILKVFYKIQIAKPDDKLSTIEGLKPTMTGLQQYLISKDKEMKKTTSRVNKAMRETVDLSDLDSKIFGKYSKFIQSKAASPPTIVPKTKKGAGATAGDKKNNKVVNNAGSGGAPPVVKPEEQETDMAQEDLGSKMDPQERATTSAKQTPTKNKSPSQQPVVRQGAQQAEQGSDQAQGPQSFKQPAVDLDTSVMTTNSRYRHENQNSVYYLKPGSQSIYLLDFKQQGFVEEELRWKNGQGQIPMQATSQQTSDSSIFIIGGYAEGMQGQPIVLNDCMQIDANMTVYQRQPMHEARFGASLALIRDRFVLALSGLTAKNKTTRSCEAYDTHTNHWFDIAQLPIGLCNTSATVMNNRFVYIMPASNQDCLKQNALVIHTLDTGNSNSFVGDKNSKSYGASIARQVWSEISVASAEFVRSQPCAALQISSNEMVIFGGETNKSFKFDTREVNMQTKQATVEKIASDLGCRGRFGHKSDFIGRIFGDIGYIIDACEKQLHCYQIGKQNWVVQSLKSLQLED